MRNKEKNNNKQISILFVIQQLRYGGAEKMIATLVNLLAKDNRFEVTIVAYDGLELNYELNSAVSFRNITIENTNRLQKKISEIVEVRKVVKEVKPDLVLSFLTNPNVYAIISTLFTGIPVIISERGNPFTNNSFLYKLKYRLYDLADGIVFQTQGAQSFFNSNVQKRSTIIPNPVIKSDFEVVEPFSIRNNRISFVARFELKQKRQDIMIYAMKQYINLRPQNREVILDFYGDGDDLEEMVMLAKSLDIDRNIVFHGKIDNVTELISSSKFFILTSDYEGIPNSLIEAMSIGLPVISTDCEPGGARLLIDSGINGLLIERGSISDLVNAMFFFDDNNIVADEMGVQAKRISDIFSQEEFEKSWIDFINNVITGKLL